MPDEKYLVAARKYRPQRFDAVVAQEHVCDTLKNAIAMDRLGHAYLFSGPRGVGKTSVARILAKSINCTTPIGDRDGAEPCQECDSCRSFSEGRSLNVIEIDAASNNKVDDVRELRETVRIPPQGGRKKVYIVDEVHMLSTSAFNALLKTLEEPPPYVLFIFATTEPNKVIPTILSRCQRFDFRRIPVVETVERLRGICAEEGITADEASLLLIAQKGDGALRDSLSVFDQAVALCGESVTYESLADALGVVDAELFFEMTNHVGNRDSAGALDLIQKVVTSGFDLHEFLSGLSEHVRNLLVAATMPDTSLIEKSQKMKERYTAAATKFERPVLLRMLAIAAETEGTLRTSVQPRLQLELGLLKMVNLSSTIDLRRALLKLDELSSALPATAIRGGTETRVERAASTDAETGPGGSHGAVERAKPEAQEKDSTHLGDSTEETADAATAEDAHDDVTTDNGAARPDVGSASTEGEVPARRVSSAEKNVTTVEPEVSASPGPDVPDLFGPPALKRRSSGSSGTIEGSVARAGVLEHARSPVENANEQPEIKALPDWLPFVKAVKAERIHVGSLLQHTAPARITGGTLFIDVPDDFHRRLLENQHDYLLRHAQDSITESISNMRFLVRSDVSATAGETAEDFDPYEYMQQKRKDNPVIRAIFDEFGGELVW